MMFQTYLKDCDCKSSGIILKDGLAVCRWCRTPYGKGGIMAYEEEHFQSKPLDNKDWEIISYLGSEGKIWHEHDCENDKYRHNFQNPTFWLTNESWETFKIYSVRRLSDNEVFSIGDMVRYYGKVTNIEKFYFNEHRQLSFKVQGEFAPLTGCFPSIHLSKLPHKLFTTTDNKDIYERDMYAIIELPSWNVSKSIGMAGARKHPNQLYFSSEQAAINYAEENKPCLSYNDVIDWLSYIYIHPDTWNKLKEIIKSKIK